MSDLYIICNSFQSNLTIIIRALSISPPEFNLPLVGSFTWLTPPGPYRGTTCREGIKFWIIYILFWPHQDMEDLPGWGISLMPGPPPRQHKHERRYTPGIHSNKANMKWWLWRPNDIRGPCGPKFSWHFPPKKPHPRNLSRQGSNPGPLCDRRACYCLFHIGGRGASIEEIQLSRNRKGNIQEQINKTLSMSYL